MATTSMEASNLFHVKGLVAIITGGGSGIGAMMARALAVNGAHRVYIVGRREDALQKVANSVETGNIIPIVGDVTSKDSIKAAADQVEKEVGFVNVVIANSGIGGPQIKITPQTTLEDFQKQLWDVDFNDHLRPFIVNTVGVWYTVVAFLQLLDKGNKKGNVEQRSQVIATSSIASFNRMAPSGWAYGQSKAGATHMMKQLATALAPYRIRSNVICPGLYPSEMGDPIIAANNNEFPVYTVPLERVGTEEEMAGALLYLTSLAGGYCNGNVLVTDGGRLSMSPSTY